MPSSSMTPSSYQKILQEEVNKIKINIEEIPKSGPSINNLGKATSNDENKEKTWDGFKKFNDIPVDPTKNIPMKPQMSKDEELREKLKILRKLERLRERKVSN